MKSNTKPPTAHALVLLLALATLAGTGSVLAQAIGDRVEVFLDATGAATDAASDAASDGGEPHRIGDLEVRLDAPSGVLAGVQLSGTLDEEGIADAARTLAIASGYGAGIETPVASFLRERAPELVGGDPVVVRLEEYELEIDVREGDPNEAVLTLRLPRVPEEAFGPPAASLGPADADVVVREFSDFQCPYCRRYAQEILPALKESLEADGSVRFEFHHFPLDSIHANATPAAEAAQCVAEDYGDDAFWAYHDLLFERQAAWQGLGEPEPYFARLASELPAEVLQRAEEGGPAAGADEAPADAPEGATEAARGAVAACLEAGRTAETVDRAAARARDLRLTGTPTVFVGGFRVQDFGNPASYSRRIRLERAIADAGDGS